MIKLGFKNLTRDRLREHVARLCTEHGTVNDVVVLQDDRWHGFALAGVAMARPEESDAVLQHFGDHKVNDFVVIMIEQK